VYPFPVETGRVLIVDDNPTIVTLLGGVLRDAGYDVRISTRGERALTLLETYTPELILLDLRMPGMDGFEVCRRLKDAEATREIPVIVISAEEDVDEKIRAFATGAADFVGKPFEAREVLARVGAHVQLYRLRRELAAQNRELQRKNDELILAERRTRHVFSTIASALPGTVLDERYRLEQKIGAGGFATVFRAKQIDLDRAVAVKVFQPWEGNDTPAALERFRREGISACRVQHPNAVSVLDFNVSGTGIAYLVMELLQGETVAELLRREGVLPIRRCAEILAPVCDALAEAHAAGVVHRDIKPDNVFLHRSARGETVKVLDFGIARLLATTTDASDPSELTRGVVGTPSYLAPERLTGREYDGRADVYSVGVMLYRMLSARLPFSLAGGADIYSQLLQQITAPLPPLGVIGLSAAAESLVTRALSKQAEVRPTAREMADALRTLDR
jgi:CheY-like chemotaxis protein